MSPALIQALRDQHRAHPSWSAQLHHENLGVLVEADPALGPMPSYATLTRAMRNRGLVRQRRRRRFEPEPVPAAETREVLSYEVSRNAGRARRPVRPDDNDGGGSPGGAGDEAAPLLKRILDDQAATGLPPAWVPHTESPEPGEDDDQGDPS